MKLPRWVPEDLLAVLCYDKEHGSAAAAILEPKHFDPVYREVAETVLDYRRRHKVPPGEHTSDLFCEVSDRDPDRAHLYDRLFESIEARQGDINPAFILDKASTFIRRQRLRAAMESAIHDLARDDEEGLNSAEVKLGKALQHTVEVFNPGVSLFEDIPTALSFLTRPEQALPTGIKELDKRSLGPVPGRLHLLSAPPGKGKSWWLVHLGAEAYKHAKRVLYVSLELGEPEVCSRFFQRFFSVTKRQVESVQYHKFIDLDADGTGGDVTKKVEVFDRPSFQDEGIEELLSRKMKRMASGERIYVRSYPQGTLNVEGLEAVLDLMEARNRFVPHLLLVDYADIMKRPSHMERWEAVIDILQGLRRIAMERQIAVATVSQVRHSGAKAETLDMEHTGGAWDKNAEADTLITYNQNTLEAENKQARLWVAKARTDESRFGIAITQAYDIGQFVVDSVRLAKKSAKKKYNKDEDKGDD